MPQKVELKLPKKKKTLQRALGALAVLVIVTMVVVLLWLNQFGLSPQAILSIARLDGSLLNQSRMRTNILILGMGGKNHEGGNLTDTIMIASLDIVTKDVVLISIPRDVWIPTLKDKINAAYAYGEEKQPGGGGLVLARSTVEEITGIPVHYGVILDFEGFTRVIDAVGGVDVTVRESFTDPLYPLKGKENDECAGDPEYLCRYESISFLKGVEHMDGERALKYVRSRHAAGDVGTDFSRGTRQQAVISALKSKVFETTFFTDFQKLEIFFDAVDQAVTTDIKLQELMMLGRMIQKSPGTRSVSLVQDEPEKNIQGVFINPPQWQYDGKWVLVPKSDNYDQIHEYINCILEKSSSCDELID